MIESRIGSLVREAIEAARSAREIDVAEVPEFEIVRTARKEHGDWATNAALKLQKAAGLPPRRIAEIIVSRLAPVDWVVGAEVAGPGFINFRLAQTWLHDAVERIERLGYRFGSSEVGSGAAVNVEFVSINPTGPLHIGAARNAALGDAVARLLDFTGYKVTREYYFNDAGSQMTNFGLSVGARYLDLVGRSAEIPEDGYVGDYVKDLAERILDEHGDRFADLPPEELAERMRELAYPMVIEWIEHTLDRFRVHMDVWFKERELYESGKVDAVIDRLHELGYVYEDGGARWLRATALGDNRDRVLVRSFGAKEPTYLVPDLAYHLEKVARGFETMIVVLGADHHGQGPSLKAGMKALGVDPNHVEVLIYQWVHLMRSGQPVPMGKRTGNFVTLDELIDAVDTDAARYTLLHTSAENTIYFDIDKVTEQSMENPVYYVQYNHARIASIFRHAGEKGVGFATADLALLTEEPETDLLKAVADFEPTVEAAARGRAPHRIARYAEELARHFSIFYEQCRVISDDPKLTRARLRLCAATKQVLANALDLLGVEAPESMEQVSDSRARSAREAKQKDDA